MISAVTLLIQDMKRSCSFYSRLPGFELVYGGGRNDNFTTYKIGQIIPEMYLNLESGTSHLNGSKCVKSNTRSGRIICHTYDVDKLYHHMRKSKTISSLINFENGPLNRLLKYRYDDKTIFALAIYTTDNFALLTMTAYCSFELIHLCTSRHNSSASSPNACILYCTLSLQVISTK
jgi:hypothetical protein